MYNIIGVSGYKGSGKNYFADFMNSHNDYKIVHFADRLKEVCAKVFNHDISEYYSGTAKERPYIDGDAVACIEIDDYLEDLKKITGLSNMTPHNKTAYSHRQLLQYIGTEYIRDANPNYWVEYLVSKIKNEPGKYLIPDTRFPNEVQVLKELGGIVVMIHRPDAVTGGDGHASENLDGIKDLVGLHVYCKTGCNDVLEKAKFWLEHADSSKSAVYTMWESGMGPQTTRYIPEYIEE